MTLASGIAKADPGHLIEDGAVAHGLAAIAIVRLVAMMVPERVSIEQFKADCADVRAEEIALIRV